MKNIKLICIAILSIITVSINSQNINWIRKSDIPIPVSKAKASVVNGKIYVIGGVTPSFRGFSTTNYEYDPATDLWTRKKDIPTGRTNYAIAVVQDKIYVIGGDPFSNKVEVYDPKTDTWDSLSNMPSKRQHLSCAVVNNIIYVIGGFEDVCCPPYPQRCNWETCAKISVLNQVYDPKTDKWDSFKSMPTPRHGHEIISVNGKIYVIGGMGKSNSIWASINSVEEYDPQTDAWATRKEMPTPRDGFGYSVQDTRIYLFGGWITEDQQTDNIYIFDTEKDKWTNSSAIPFKTGACAYVTIDNKIYLFGGDNEDYKEIYSFTYEGEIIE